MERSSVFRTGLHTIQLAFHQWLGSNKVRMFKAIKCRAACLTRNTEKCEGMSPKLFVFFTKFFPHQTALTHNYVMIRSSRRTPKGDKRSNSVAWWEYSAAVWSDGIADDLAIWLPQKRCNNSKIHSRVSYSGNRDGDSSLWLRSTFSFFRRRPQ